MDPSSWWVFLPYTTCLPFSYFPAAACGAVPMTFILYTYAPFVSYVHVQLPRHARQSREIAMKWAERIGKDTEVDLTTIRSLGRSRVTRLPFSALRRSTGRLGVVNLRAVNEPHRARAWWMGKPLREFYVGTEQSKRWEHKIWQNAWKQIPTSGGST